MSLGQVLQSRQRVVDAKSQDESPTEQPLDRAFTVLSVVADAARPISVTEVAAICDVPVPSVHRIAAQLERRGLLSRALGSKRLVVGRALVNLGIASLEAALRTDRPHQVLVMLANRVGEHCQIGRCIDDAIVYVDSAKALRSDGLYFEQGRRAPMHCTSTGKLFLAEMNDAELDWWLAHADLQKLGPTTLTTPAALKTAIRRIRRDGWATSNQELSAGVVGCAVPIRTASGKLIAGLGVSAPSARQAPEQLIKFRDLMHTAAAEIAAAVSDED